MVPQASTTGAAKSPRAKPTDETDGFLEFWAMYPRKVAKPQALATWHKAINGGASAGQIILCLRQFPFSSDPQYHPYPATWLNAKHWLDEAPTAPVTTEAPPGDRLSALDGIGGRRPSVREAMERMMRRGPPDLLGSLRRAAARDRPSAEPPAFNGLTVDHNPGDNPDDRS